MKKKYKIFAILAVLICVTVAFSGCVDDVQEVSDSGAKKVSVQVPKGNDGLTTEQRNIMDRIKITNDPSNIQYLYVISAYSGQVIYQSTVLGKVTSSGKRINPYSVEVGQYLPDHGIKIGDNVYETTEVIQDDGTFGSSEPYLYWWDINGNYHQHYISGGTIVHIASYPCEFKDVILNMDILGENSTGWE